MKMIATAIITLAATVALANPPAAQPATAPAAHPAPKAEVAKKDCTKMTGEAKAKCEAEMKAHK
ncbi:MAG: hypothetical protein LW875_11150 [Proteobacteria bacterium]|jgi:hypothetical protein|nr:hypothetical protein [Pseudomonadota bacterium]